MNSQLEWPVETEEALKRIEGKEGYTLIIGVCFVYAAYNFLKRTIPNLYSIRIQNGQLQKNYPFDKLKPSSIIMLLAWGNMAACLEEPRHSGYINDYYIPILQRIKQIDVPTLILDFPGCPERYCFLGDPAYSDIPTAAKGYVYRSEAEKRGWVPPNETEQDIRKANYWKKCIFPVTEWRSKICYYDLQPLIGKSFYPLHNTETREDYVGVAPWHWDDVMIQKIVNVYNIGRDDMPTADYFRML